MELDVIYNTDCLQGLISLPNKCVDLVVTDPPYEFDNGGGGGAFGSKKRDYHAEYLSLYKEQGKTRETERLRILSNTQKNIKNTGGRLLSYGFDFSILDECCRVLKKINFYVWCSKAQVGKLLNYFEGKGCNTDILVWCKTNPTPMCNGTYLSDIEYCVFAREKGVKMFGEYATKHKFYVTSCNKKDKEQYGHPTIKPIEIIRNLIINSSNEGDIVLDSFMGSGTTAVAAKQLNRHFIGYEIMNIRITLPNGMTVSPDQIKLPTPEEIEAAKAAQAAREAAGEQASVEAPAEEGAKAAGLAGQAASAESNALSAEQQAQQAAASGSAPAAAPAASEGRPTVRRTYTNPNVLAAGRRVQQSAPKIGRNDMCWCGSGLKYKKCHGKGEGDSED